RLRARALLPRRELGRIAAAAPHLVAVREEAVGQRLTHLARSDDADLHDSFSVEVPARIVARETLHAVPRAAAGASDLGGPSMVGSRPFTRERSATSARLRARRTRSGAVPLPPEGLPNRSAIGSRYCCSIERDARICAVISMPAANGAM